jgi:phospholipid/cholesterol/gamma-HCH transport system substrate-binding protein
VDAIRMNPKPESRQRNILVVMRVDRRFEQDIRTDSTASLITEGLLGNRYVSIKRGFTGTPIPVDGEVRGEEEAAIKAIVERGAELVQNLTVLSQHARQIVEGVERGQGTLGKILTDDSAYVKLTSVLGRADQIVADVQAGKGTIGGLVASNELYDKAHSVASRADTLLADVQGQKGSLGRFIYDTSLHDQTRQFLDRANAVVNDVQAGKGTLGKLYADDSLYVKWRDTGTNLEAATARLRDTTGTAGKFFSDPQLYDNLSGLTGDMRLLIGEFRQNPKKFLRVKFSLF